MSINEESNSANKDASCLNTIMVNVYSCAPCVPCMPCTQHYMPKPKTPNIDKLNEIINKIKELEPNNHGINGVIRTKSNDLTDWTKKVVAFLPCLHDAEETLEQRKHLVDHFKTIKKFYDASFYDAFVGINSPEIQAFYNAIQIYESVLSISFVLLTKNPDIINSINKYLSEAIRTLTHYKKLNIFTRFMYGRGVLSNFNKYLALLDDKIGQLGIPKIMDYISDKLEIFCKYVEIGIERMFESYTTLSVSIKQTVHEVSLTLRSVFGESIPGFERKKQWGPLELTEKIKTKLSKFDQKSKLVERIIVTFENFFSSVEELQNYFERCFETRIITQLIDTQIANIDEAILEQIKEVAKIVQHLETIISYGILLFKNEDDVLNPLLDYVDECTKILNKFSMLHPLYKTLLGKNYLSNLKLVLKNILDLLNNSSLVLTPKEFLGELKQKYPNLIYLLCESYLNDTLKKNLEFLPDSVKKAIDSACRIALSKLGDKLIYHSDENIPLSYNLETDSLFKYRQAKPKETVNSIKRKSPVRQYTETEVISTKSEEKIQNEIATKDSSSDESLNKENTKLIQSQPSQSNSNNAISFKHFLTKTNIVQPNREDLQLNEDDSVNQSKSFSIISQDESVDDNKQNCVNHSESSK